MVSRSDSKSIHPLLNQKKPHPPHEVLVSKKSFRYFKIFHCIPYELLFLKKLKCKKNPTHVKRAHLIFIDELWKTQKIKNIKKIIIITKKNCWRYHYFTRVYQKSQLYEVQFLWYEEWKNKVFKKQKKISWKYHQFTQVYQKLWLDDAQFLRYGARPMNGQTGRQKKWQIEVSAWPKNICLINIQLST